MPQYDHIGSISKASFWYRLSILFTGITTIAAIFIIRLQIGNDAYATFNLSFNYCLIGILVGQGWINYSILRFVNLSSEETGVRPGSLIKYGSISAIVIAMSGGLWFYYVLKVPDIAWLMAILMIGGLYSIFLSLAQALQNSSIYFKAELLRSVLNIIGITIPFIFKIPASPSFFFIIYVLSYSIALLLLVAMSRTINFLRQGQTGIIRIPATKILRFGLPLSITSLGTYIILFSDRYFILRSGDVEHLGYYVVIADLIIKGIGFLLSPLNTAAYPVLTAVGTTNSMAEIRTIESAVSKKLVWLMLAATILFLIGYKLLFMLIKVPANNEVQYLTAGLILLLACGLLQIAFLYQKHLELILETGRLMLVGMTAAIIAVVANTWLVPKLGILGGPLSVLAGSVSMMAGIMVLRKSYTIKA